MPNHTPTSPQDVAPVEKPEQFSAPQLGIAVEDSGALIQAPLARALFSVDGEGLTVAVLDTGLRTTHVDFAGRVLAQRNFTSDNGGDINNASDGNGHGTNVGGIIIANEDHIGIAPGANIIPLKVLSNAGGGSFAAINDALQWVIDNRETHHITVACMSLGDGENYTTDADFAGDAIREKIQTLRDAHVAVVVAAGNDFFTHDSAQGMSYPAIFRETVSVGAVFDADEGSLSYISGAVAFSSDADRITPFSQRLHESVNPDTRTDIFAPGAPITSSGIEDDHGESVQHGTSQATPVTAGVILLMQQYHLQLTDHLPSVDDLIRWLRNSGVPIHDGDDEADNVMHTGLDFLRLDALNALQTIRRHLRRRLLDERQPLKRVA